MTKKNAIVTFSIGPSNPMYDLANKAMQAYANRIQADYIKITEKQLNLDWPVDPKYVKKQAARLVFAERLCIFDLLKTYERVVLIDGDILISPDAPDIFAHYPDASKVYLLDESPYYPEAKDAACISGLLGTVTDWPRSADTGRSKYFNFGVFLFSRESGIADYVDMNELKGIFNEIQHVDQSYVNYLIFKHHIPHGDLDPRFNWMNCMGDYDARHHAYFVHHAGRGYGKSSRYKIKTFVHDYYRLYGGKPSLSFRFLFPLKLEWRRAKIRLKRLGYRLLEKLTGKTYL